LRLDRVGLSRKTQECDGYTAVQLGYKDKKIKTPQNHPRTFQKSGIPNVGCVVSVDPAALEATQEVRKSLGDFRESALC
jgi:hypothetical protein